jgi:hypothetical protein
MERDSHLTGYPGPKGRDAIFPCSPSLKFCRGVYSLRLPSWQVTSAHLTSGLASSVWPNLCSDILANPVRMVALLNPDYRPALPLAGKQAQRKQ